MARNSNHKQVKSSTRGKSNGVSETDQPQPIKVPDAIEVPEQPYVKVTFLHVGEDLTLPTLMVESVLKAMQGVEIIQLTDMVTPQIKGVRGVIRKPYDGNLMTFRMQHLAELEGAWITLDTDVLVLKDLREVFNKGYAFDVALTRRYGKILDGDGIDIVAYMPYNTGVMFSNNRSFWKDAYKALLRMPESAHKWWGDQLSVRLAAESGKFNVLELDCDTYNYTPKDEQERKDCFVLHFKGKRKDWMINGNYNIR